MFVFQTSLICMFKMQANKNVKTKILFLCFLMYVLCYGSSPLSPCLQESLLTSRYRFLESLVTSNSHVGQLAGGWVKGREIEPSAHGISRKGQFYLSFCPLQSVLQLQESVSQVWKLLLGTDGWKRRWDRSTSSLCCWITRSMMEGILCLLKGNNQKMEISNQIREWAVKIN